MKTLAELSRLAEASGKAEGKILSRRFGKLDRERQRLKVRYARITEKLSRLKKQHTELKGHFSSLKAAQAKLDLDLQAFVKVGRQ